VAHDAFIFFKPMELKPEWRSECALLVNHAPQDATLTQEEKLKIVDGTWAQLSELNQRRIAQFLRGDTGVNTTTKSQY